MRKISLAVIVLLAIILGWRGMDYYRNTYMGQRAYAQVTTVPAKTATRDQDGKKEPGYYSYIYHFTWVYKDGSTRQQTFEQSSEDPKPFKAGSYVTAVVSKNRVIKGPVTVKQTDIPAKALSVLQG